MLFFVFRSMDFGVENIVQLFALLIACALFFSTRSGLKLYEE